MMASFDPTTTLVVMALSEESNGLFEAAGIQPLYTGVGQVKAAFALTSALAKMSATKKPSRVLNLGTAGSFEHAQHDCFECLAFVQRTINSVGFKSKKIAAAEPITSLPGAICGTADFIQNSIFEKGNSDFQIMDMEAYALAYVCQQFQISFHAIKFVSDHSNELLISDWKKNLEAGSRKLLEVFQTIR